MRRGRVPMRAIREILRLSCDRHLTYRRMEQALEVSHGTVAPVIQRFQAAEAVWPWGPDGDDGPRERWLYPGNRGRPQTRPEPDWAAVHQELRSRCQGRIGFPQNCQDHSHVSAAGKPATGR